MDSHDRSSNFIIDILKSDWFHRWQATVGVVITVFGSLLAVWWQTSRTTNNAEEILKQVGEMIETQRWPLEGRWSYHIDPFDSYRGKKLEEDESNRSVSNGLAEIVKRGNSYSILLGYANKKSTGEMISGSINTGSFSLGIGGVPKKDTEIHMRYGPRVSEGNPPNPPVQDFYIYIIDELVEDESGKIIKIRMTLDAHTTTGKVVLTRIP